MSDQTPNATASAAPAAEAPKAPKVTQPHQNGVSMPKSGTKTGRVWEIANELSAKEGKPAARKSVIDQGLKEGINPATLATQYGRWRKFHGLKAEPRQVTATPEAPAAVPTASDTTVEKA